MLQGLLRSGSRRSQRLLTATLVLVGGSLLYFGTYAFLHKRGVFQVVTMRVELDPATGDVVYAGAAPIIGAPVGPRLPDGEPEPGSTWRYVSVTSWSSGARLAHTFLGPAARIHEWFLN